MNIFERTLKLWSNGEIIEGVRYDKCVHTIRVRYRTYLIITNKSLLNIMSKMKSYQQLEEEYNNSLLTITKESNVSTIKNPELTQTGGNVSVFL